MLHESSRRYPSKLPIWAGASLVKQNHNNSSDSTENARCPPVEVRAQKVLPGKSRIILYGVYDQQCLFSQTPLT